MTQPVPVLSSQHAAPLDSSPKRDSFHPEEKIPMTVWFLGIMMLCINLSYIMIYSLSGVYLKSAGIPTDLIVLIDGVAEGTSYGMKLMSGVVSDYLRRRKLVIVIGYGLMVISRALIAILPTFATVFAARFVERIGNGVQGTPRDALVSDVAPIHKKGESFGLMRSLGIAGSFFGCLVASALMKITGNSYDVVFYAASVPAVLSLIILLVYVKEPKEHLDPKDRKKRHPIHLSDLPRLGLTYWLLMIIAALFMLARVNETLLTLHATQNFGLNPSNAPYIMLVYNATYCLSAYPIGRLSDRMGRFGLLCYTIITLIVADLFLAYASNLFFFYIGVLIWGLQMGMSQSLFMAYVADLAPEDLRGTAFGFYYFVCTLSSFMAGLGAGKIAKWYGEGGTYMASCIVAGIALIALLLVHRPLREEDRIIAEA